MNAIYQRFIIALLILVGGWLVLQFPSPVVQIGNATLQVEIADTKELRTKGLSGKTQLQENEGMLFVFKKPGDYGFWMKDMNFAIDIIWIGQDKKVVGIMSNISPTTFPEGLYSKEPIQYVVETNAGWAEQNGIMVGDRAKF